MTSAVVFLQESSAFLQITERKPHMLVSIAIILLSGLMAGWLFEQLHLPALTGRILTGILIGPYALNLISTDILNVSADLRRIALIIILIRAGLKLDLGDLRKAGRPAFLLCFVPACFEIAGTVLLAPRLLHLSLLESAILGSVLAAVSPAVVVPKMIKLIDEKYGTEKQIPQMILAGASVDDVVVIVLFTTFTTIANGGEVSLLRFAMVPVSVLTGMAAGLLIGRVFVWFYNRYHIRDTVKLIVLFSIAFLLNGLEAAFPSLPFASLIAIMFIGIGVLRNKEVLGVRLAIRSDKLWAVAEIFLFVLVGASVRIEHALQAGFLMVLLLFGALLFRMAGTALSVSGTRLNRKERLFCMMAYTPKATVQAAIGGIPLAMGLSCGDLVLTCSVVAILLTAPLGAFLIDNFYKRLLEHDG